MNIDQNKVVGFGQRVNGYCENYCEFLSADQESIEFIQSSDEQPYISDNKTLENITALGLTILIITGLIGLISWLQLWQVKKKLRNNSIADNANSSRQNLKSFSQVSCYKCKYFHDNFYLKCAIHPTKVLQPEARDCNDYEQKDVDIDNI